MNISDSFPRVYFANPERTHCLYGEGLQNNQSSFNNEKGEQAASSFFAFPFHSHFHGEEWREFAKLPREWFPLTSHFLPPSPAREKSNPPSPLYYQEVASYPDFDHFSQTISQYRQQAFGKVVLARKKVYRLLDDFCLADFLPDFINYLRSRQEDSYLFSLQINEHDAFISTSPEMLFKKENNKIKTDAIAGTRPRGKTLEEDEKLTQDLLRSNKDRQEQVIVTEDILRSLQLLHSEKSLIPISHHQKILKLQHLQHIQTCIEMNAPAGKNLNALEVVKALHPTPAVGGSPRATALSFIFENELQTVFDRGLYAAPMGVCLPQFKYINALVGIRSALFHGQELHLFAGAGILPQSNPEEEWKEIDSKFAHFENLLQLKPIRPLRPEARSV